MQRSKIIIGWLAALSLVGCLASPADIRQGELDQDGEEVGVSAQALSQIEREWQIEAKAAANPNLVGTRITPFSDHGNGASAGYSGVGNNLSIYFGDAHGFARMVYGYIRGKYLATGGHTFLGYPITDEESTLYGTGRYNNFQWGRILWKTGNQQAFEVHGCILHVYNQIGTEWGYQGFPLTDEHQSGNRRRNIFEYGRLHWRASGSSNCLDNVWPTHTGVNPQNKLWGSGIPRITGATISQGGTGSVLNMNVQGSGFSPGTVNIDMSNPQGYSGSFWASVDASGNFNKTFPNVSTTSVQKVNGYATVVARQVSLGKIAAYPISTQYGVNVAPADW